MTAGVGDRTATPAAGPQGFRMVCSGRRPWSAWSRCRPKQVSGFSADAIPLSSLRTDCPIERTVAGLITGEISTEVIAGNLDLVLNLMNDARGVP